MNCTTCTDKVCRKQQESCNREDFQKTEVLEQYADPEISHLVASAANLVDNGRAGTLSRLDEIIEYSHAMNYKSIGLAYCFGMEKYAVKLRDILTENGFSVSAVSCSIGGFKQSEVNQQSCIHKVSCNPLGQALQLNNEGVDLTLIMGICVGHDILLNRTLNMDFTTFVVKDRKYNHSPLQSLVEN